MLTVRELCTDAFPALDSVVVHYDDKNATIPPGSWVRKCRGCQWLTQNVPGSGFFYSYGPGADCQLSGHF
ncbi:TPA: hypothetical protein ACIVB1_001847 [Salmonella enterica subsp. diarizonae serovar 61:l,v:z35]